jgi:membrane-associated phospholipid phosphatase
MKQSTEIKHFVFKNLYSKLFAITILIGIIPLIFQKKADMVIFINNHFATNTFDNFFIYFSDTAQGYLFVIPIICILFYNYRMAAIISFVGVLVFLTSLICKQFLFPDFPRPTVFIGLENFFHTMPGFNYKENFSFPSGHTMGAFAFGAIVSYLTKNPKIHLFLFVYAIAIAFSRMYLLQHFYMDVFAGAFIGYLIVIGAISRIAMFDKIPQRGILS